MDDNIYAPLPGVEFSGEGINGCDLSNAKLFERIELSDNKQKNVSKRKLIQNVLISRAVVDRRIGWAIR